MPGINDGIFGGTNRGALPESDIKTPEKVSGGSESEEPLPTGPAYAGHREGEIGTKLGPDDLNPTNRLMDIFNGHTNEIDKSGGEEPGGSTNPFDSIRTPGRGYGKNLVSRDEMIGKKDPDRPMNMSVQNWTNDHGGVTMMFNTDSSNAMTVIVETDKYDRVRTWKEVGVDGSTREYIYDPSGKEVYREGKGSSSAPSTPTTAPTNLPTKKELAEEEYWNQVNEQEAAVGADPEETKPYDDGIDVRTGGKTLDQAALERKRQITLPNEGGHATLDPDLIDHEAFQEGFVRRVTDGRSTPVDTDGTVTGPGETTPGSTGDFDLSTQHKKGDPSDEGGPGGDPL